MNRAWPSHPFGQKLADWLNWPCPVSAALQKGSQDLFGGIIIQFSHSKQCECLPGIHHVDSLALYWAVKSALLQVDHWFGGLP